MTINPISSNLINLLTDEAVKTKESGNSNFSDIFSEAMNTVSTTDTLDKMSSVELLTGTSDDFSGLLLDAQKAEISLNLALQLRNKLIEAYSEIMRMQV